MKTRAPTSKKLLADEKVIEGRKQALIADLLRQKEAAIRGFDEKLAKLGYQTTNSGGKKRSHHKKAAAGDAAKPASNE